MPKRLEITQKIQDHIKHSVGDVVDPLTIVAFEAIAITSKPVSKRGSIFDKSIVTQSMISAMAQVLQQPGAFVPLHTLHDQGYSLPVGRVFYGEMEHDQTTDVSALRVLFYVDASEDDLIRKLDSGSIDEVSIGTESEHMLCSECGWDYKGDTATLDNFYSRTCENGHTIGENGVHLKLTGLARFYELSLVSIGASKDAKILPRTKHLLATADLERLAASGLDAGAVVLITKHKEPSMTTTPNTDPQAARLSELQTQVIDLSVNEKVLTAKLTAAETTVATLTEQVTKLSAAEAAIEAATKAQADAEAVAAKALTFLQAQTSAALVATGAAVTEAPGTVDACIATLTEAQKNLVNLFPVNGKTTPTGASDTTLTAAEGSKAFQVRR